MILAILIAAAPVNIALTVDDLPSHGPEVPGESRLEIAQKFLAVFHKHRVPQVYGFVNGHLAEENPQLQPVLEAWRAAGYPLGNHTWSHVNPNETPLPQYLAEIERGESIGLAKVFRYPFLFEGDTPERRTQTAQWLREHGYAKADVTIDFDDWQWAHPWTRCSQLRDETKLGELRHLFLDSSVRMLQRTRKLAKAVAGREVSHVLLLHISAATADQLDVMLNSWEEAGAKWVSLEEAQRDPIYAEDPGFQTRWGWTLLDRLAKQRAVKIDDNFWPDEERLEKICK